MRHIVRILIILPFTVITFYIAFASDIFPLSLKQRTENALMIAEGKVVSQYSFWDASHHNIYTSNLVKIYKLFKGNLFGEEIEIITEGGTVAMVKHVFSSTLSLKIGESGIFFCLPHTIKGSGRPVNSSESFMIYSSLQGFIAYNIKENTAKDPFMKYASINQAGIIIKAITGTEKNISENPDVLPGNSAITNQTAVMPVITSLSPATIPAGTGAILTIQGSGFGASRGTGFVEFRNSDDGGVSLEQPLASDYISWTDGEIQVKVPSEVLDGAGCAGTGTVRVTNSDPGTATSSSTLIISYAYSNINDHGFSAMPYHISNNGMGGYTFHMENGFSANAAANAAFVRAINTWTCNTAINWIVGAPTSVNSTADDGINVVRFDIGAELPAGVLGRATSRYNGCGTEPVYPFTWLVVEIDLEFNDSPPSPFTWQFGPGTPASNEIDFETVALHELGHGHQLSHTVSPGAVMHFALSNGQTSRTLSQTDLDGANFIMARNLASSPCGLASMVTGTCTVVPIKLVSFNGSYFPNSGALLSWKTARETNITGYRIQRSKDGYRFTDMSFLKSNKLKQANTYEYRDLAIPEGKWYYRLSIVNADASEKSSHIIFINAGGKAPIFTVNPNPAKNYLLISGSNIDLNGAVFELISMDGRKVISRLFSEKVSSFSKQISLSELAPGLYLYILHTSTGKIYSGKIKKSD